jgi:predicted negative regulator of RcsB-dependent stress response
MPQVIALALLGAGLYAGYRWITRTTREIAAQMQRADDAVRQDATGRIEKNLGTLEYDPASGVYRPARKS